jgi:hypothetical protein
MSHKGWTGNPTYSATPSQAVMLWYGSLWPAVLTLVISKAMKTLSAQEFFSTWKLESRNEAKYQENKCIRYIHMCEVLQYVLFLGALII